MAYWQVGCRDKELAHKYIPEHRLAGRASEAVGERGREGVGILQILDGSAPRF